MSGPEDKVNARPPMLVVFIVGAAVGTWAYVGFMWWTDETGWHAMKQCRKENNVYACEMIAVPSPPEMTP